MMKVFAAFVKPRTEREVEAGLASFGVGSILPMITFQKRVSRHTNKTIDAEKLAIPGLFFVDEAVFVVGAERLKGFMPGFRGLMKYHGAWAEFPLAQIEEFEINCRSMVETKSGLRIDGGSSEFVCGDRVRVCVGPFSGMEGVVLEVRGRVACLETGVSTFVTNIKARLDFLEKISDSQHQDDR